MASKDEVEAEDDHGEGIPYWTLTGDRCLEVERARR